MVHAARLQPPPQLPVPHASASGETPGGSPGWAWHGVAAGPSPGSRVAIPVVSVSASGTTPTKSATAGGQSCDGPSMPVNAPATEQMPPTHRGQTCSVSVRKIRVWSATVCSNSPVWRFAVPPLKAASLHSFMRQSGSPPSESGRGGPKAVPFGESGPVGTLTSQRGLVVVSQPVRQARSSTPPANGKLWNAPVHPRSRSLP
jgi:hypothetical protein